MTKPVTTKRDHARIQWNSMSREQRVNRLHELNITCRDAAHCEFDQLKSFVLRTLIKHTEVPSTT